MSELKKICVRCESKENISMYRHKTPALSTVKYRRHSTTITTYGGTGGIANVPVCNQCKKLFSRWKILFPLAKTLSVISFVVFALYLIYIVMVPDPFTRAEIKFLYAQLPALISGIFTLIFGIPFIYLKLSPSNPNKFVRIYPTFIVIKPINTDKWVPIPTTDI